MTRELFGQIVTILWVSGGDPSKRLIQKFGYDLDSIQDDFGRELNRQIANGDVTRAVGSDGEPLLVFGAGRRGTLRDIIEPYCTNPDTKDHSRKAVWGAVRYHFGLPGTLPYEDLYARCEEISLLDAYSFPEVAYDAGRREGKGPQAANWKSNLRAAMTAAAEQPLLIAFPAQWSTVVGSDVTRVMISALARVWADGKEPSETNLQAAGGPNPGSVRRRIAEMEQMDQAVLRPHLKRGRTLAWIYFGNGEPRRATLADAVQAYVADEEHSERQQRALRTALRSYFEIPYASDERILQACTEVPCRDLHGWADRIQATLVAKGSTKKQARSDASAIRMALLFAAENGAIPLYFGDGSEDSWDEARDKWIPKTPGRVAGAKRETRFVHRVSWGRFAEAVRSIHGEAGPEQVTAEMADAALDWMKERGRFDHAQAASHMLNWLAKQGFGPRKDYKPAVEGDHLLKGENGDGCATYDRFLAALRFNGLPPEWLEFFEWYRTYSTLGWEELELQRDEAGGRRFPERAASRQLSQGTLLMRSRAVRWLLGISKDFLAVDLSRLPLDEAFGLSHLRQVTAQAQQIWRRRAEAGELSSPYGTALRQYITMAGLVAEAIYERRRHERGEEVAIVRDAKKPSGIDALAEEGVAKSAIEDQLWRAYKYSRSTTDNIANQAKGFGDTSNTNTVKDLAKIVKKTPPDWYWRLHGAAIALARRSLETDGESEGHHRLIRDVYALGWLLSTGVRGAELAHVRLDLQYPAQEWSKRSGDREARLAKEDRKNERAHTVGLREIFVPHWLEQAYLEVSRPWLMRDLKPTAEQWGLRRGYVHRHLIVDNSGEALGCVEEHSDRSGRDSKEVETRVNRFRDTFKNRFGRIAWEHCELKCPTGDSEFTLHTIRNVMGYFLYQRAKSQGDQHPAMAAANYLGDDPSMVDGIYGGIDGTLIDSALFREMASWSGAPVMGPDEGEAIVSPQAVEPDSGSSLFERLRVARDEVLQLGTEWGLSPEEIDKTWDDRKRGIMEAHSRKESLAG